MIKVLAETDSQFVLSKFEQVNESIYQENFPKIFTAVAARGIGNADYRFGWIRAFRYH